MKVFLSWSGTVSHRVALALKAWLPLVIHSLEPYVSSEDIDKGARWSSDISQELEVSQYGIICVTRDNLNAPWLNFEAGALSKSIEKSRVSPFLYGIKRSEVKGPLLQFQSTAFELADVRKLISTLNLADGTPYIDAGRLDAIFAVMWPQLESALAGIDQVTDGNDAEKSQIAGVSSIEILEEILELARTQQKLLTSPDRLLPLNYLQAALEGTALRETSPQAYFDLDVRWKRLREFVDALDGETDIPLTMLRELVGKLGVPIRFLLRHGRYEQTRSHIAPDHSQQSEE